MTNNSNSLIIQYVIYYLLIFNYSFCLFIINLLHLGMNDELISMIEASGLKKKFIAVSIGVTPNHFSNCIAGTRTLSRKKEQKLISLLSPTLQSA